MIRFELLSRPKSVAILAAGSIALAGCSSSRSPENPLPEKSDTPDPELTATPTAGANATTVENSPTQTPTSSTGSSADEAKIQLLCNAPNELSTIDPEDERKAGELYLEKINQFESLLPPGTSVEDIKNNMDHVKLYIEDPSDDYTQEVSPDTVLPPATSLKGSFEC